MFHLQYDIHRAFECLHVTTNEPLEPAADKQEDLSTLDFAYSDVIEAVRPLLPTIE